MSVKEDWRRKQTVNDETLEENWKLMFGDKERTKTNEREVHERISKIWNEHIQDAYTAANEEAMKGAQIVTKEDLGIRVSPEAHTRIKNYSGEAILTIPEEDRVCTWHEEVEYVEFMMVFVSYHANCGNSFRKHRYDAKLEDVFKKATCCIHCGKKVKWKD